MSDTSLPPDLPLPRVLCLYDDDHDDDGTAVGWRLVAWAVDMPGRGAVTISIGPPLSATVWHSLDAALDTLKVYVDEPRPRRRVMGGTR